MVLQVDEVVDEYRSFARFPQPSSATIYTASSDGQVLISSCWTQRDLERSEKVKFTKAYSVSTDQDHLSACTVSGPQEVSNEVWNKVSPSGKLRAVVRTVINKKKEEKQFIEIWSGSCKLKNVDVQAKEKHGKIYDKDGQFGSLEWSHSEGHLLYIAEEKQPKTSSFFTDKKSEDEDTKKATEEKAIPGDEFLVHEEWGEGLVGKHHPIICVLDVDTGEISVLENVPDDISPGLAVWAPDDTGVVFTGWDHEPFRLGLIYCVMRRSAVYYLELQKASCESLTPRDRASRCTVFSPDGRKFVYIDNNVGGPHYQCSRLLVYDWETRKSEVIVDVVSAPLEGDSFPGLYAVCLPSRCWCEDSKRVVLNTTWKHSQASIVVNTETKSVCRVPCESGASLSILDVQSDLVIAQTSSYNTPHYLVISKVPVEGKEATFNWNNLDETGETLPDIKWKIYTHQPTEERKSDKYSSLQYESIYLYPEIKGTEKPPLIVFPHGGPHSVFTTEFALYPSLMARCGIATLMVNYRGSCGYGSDGIYSLLGHVGDMDVKDVQCAAVEVIEKEGLDPSKVVVMGGSHGGFLTCHLIGQYPDFYRAAVCRNPVTNMATLCGTSDIADWNFIESGLEFDYERLSSLADDKMLPVLWKMSPLQYVDKVKTPLMIMIGLDDRRVHPKQSYEMYKALKARNVEVRYIAYPDNGHPIVKVDSEADAFMNIYKWFYDHGPVAK